ncbi:MULTISPECIES: hypothetical protein [Lysobacter]|uniref:hypothetical protein n=1 Tax=Lysobacter TaxID=68 RepID=UPI001F24178E|nr:MULTISPECIES: hypothetical protein [Lysobacter]UJB19463.1 hypothetical protein L1A79_24725 [Lysobacter capsici]UJQ26811.1 hypothetical protein L2D09_15160 [Lysobacter gummosus]
MAGDKLTGGAVLLSGLAFGGNDAAGRGALRAAGGAWVAAALAAGFGAAGCGAGTVAGDKLTGGAALLSGLAFGGNEAAGRGAEVPRTVGDTWVAAALAAGLGAAGFDAAGCGAGTAAGDKLTGGAALLSGLAFGGNEAAGRWAEVPRPVGGA